MEIPSLEEKVKAKGQEIFSLVKGETPSIFDKRWWSGKMIDWCLANEAFKVQLFRFIDALPSLNTPEKIARHLQEYMGQSGQDLPAIIQWGLGHLAPSSLIARAAASRVRKEVNDWAYRFIAGATLEEALPKLKEVWASGMTFTVDLLGEAVVSEEEADLYQARYLELLPALAAAVNGWPAIDEQREKEFPRVNISLKISSLYSQIDPADYDGSVEAVKNRLRPIFRQAMEVGAFINLDMEQYQYKDLTLAVFKQLLEEKEFQAYPHAGIVIQSYLRDAEKDLQQLIAWSRRARKPITVRLVKGAYWDYETVIAGQRGWPVPVFSQKWQTDANFEKLSHLLLENCRHVKAAIASHNIRSLAHALVKAEELGLPLSRYEFQALYGMAEPIKAALVKMGLPVREYVPLGELLPGIAYFVRRLLENTSNESFLRQSFGHGVSADELLKPPREVDQ